MKKITFFTLLLFATAFISNASPRTVFSINESWQFLRDDEPGAWENNFDDSKWERVDLPHTWNAFDVMDEVPHYYRGPGWYRRTIYIPQDKENGRVTIYFEGVNQEVDLYINGKSAGSHVGGYTRFSFDITDYLRFGEKNQFAIKVNNRHNENIPPLSADFTFFGGIYRDVYLIYTNNQHISTTHYASPGIYITTPEVSEKEAAVEIKTILSNRGNTAKKVIVEHTIIDPDKNISKVISKQINLAKNNAEISNIQKVTITNPELWSTESPNLYSVLTRVYDSKTKVLFDETVQPLGLRWFEFTTEKGFVLNGKPLKLIGTSRHQCYDKMGNALPDEIHVKDVMLLKSMGGNFLRVSHYPQDPVIMEMCDKLGIVTSVEIPIVNAITENTSFYRNCLEMAREMVFQDFNRPSVVIWAYMNEVLLRVPFTKDEQERRDVYLSEVNKLAIQLEEQIRKDDPYRYTLIPFHGNFNEYHNAGLTQIPMIIGWNLYQGWYGNGFDKFDVFLDEAQDKLKGIPFIITEYGADADPRLHSFEPKRFDYTAEYANMYHEHYLKTIMERTYVVGANIWNLNDFHSETRANAVPHINNKGITSTTRELKDTYLQYKAAFFDKPVVLIGGSNWNIRGGNGDENYTCKQPVKVYSNLPEIELVLNSESLGCKRVNDNIAEFEVPFVNGENILEAVGKANGKEVRDLLKIDFRMISYDLKDEKLPFREINVMLGSKRYFEDKTNSVIWIPEKEYTKSSWGYIGGTEYAKRTRHGHQPASDLDILGTTDDPVFQTMRMGLEAFKLDVPDGQYTISFYWAELQSSEVVQLAYNLGNDALADDFSERVFDVSINNQKVISDFNIAEQYGQTRAVVMKYIINVNNNEGITIGFEPQKGEAILNAIRVYRNY